ncbi:uncharacterized protein ACHE_21316A [Aspergillus chevalieri]|uniref:Uncharacterized protein n=1 Tax=Aspergillus chevalieri TaxID=182096 RepID=A0A7R7VJH0_ASPCH|nr:uncharacterized protein ACHE_21316A [Aspergillus chevalieri]BCR85858.1 hypothetical protein ACHE_21316A [Aspergillus chevalieri]
MKLFPFPTPKLLTPRLQIVRYRHTHFNMRHTDPLPVVRNPLILGARSIRNIGINTGGSILEHAVSRLDLVYLTLAVLATSTVFDLGLKIVEVLWVVAFSRIAYQVKVWVQVDLVLCFWVINQDADLRVARARYVSSAAVSGYQIQ